MTNHDRKIQLYAHWLGRGIVLSLIAIVVIGYSKSGGDAVVNLIIAVGLLLSEPLISLSLSVEKGFARLLLVMVGAVVFTASVFVVATSLILNSKTVGHDGLLADIANKHTQIDSKKIEKRNLIKSLDYYDQINTQAKSPTNKYIKRANQTTAQLGEVNNEIADLQNAVTSIVAKLQPKTSTVYQQIFSLEIINNPEVFVRVLLTALFELLGMFCFFVAARYSLKVNISNTENYILNTEIQTNTEINTEKNTKKYQNTKNGICGINGIGSGISAASGGLEPIDITTNTVDNTADSKEINNGIYNGDINIRNTENVISNTEMQNTEIPVLLNTEKNTVGDETVLSDNNTVLPIDLLRHHKKIIKSELANLSEKQCDLVLLAVEHYKQNGGKITKETLRIALNKSPNSVMPILGVVKKIMRTYPKSANNRPD